MGATATVDNAAVVQKADVVFVSTKPSVVPAALQQIKNLAAGKLFISVAMGITIDEIETVRHRLCTHYRTWNIAYMQGESLQ